jgi:hypothetical protein
MRRRKTIATWGGLALLVASTLPLGSQVVTAADHADAPGTMADPAADIADLYAWHTADGTIVAIVTFQGLQNPGEEPDYDSELLYTIHIDNTADPMEKADWQNNDNDNESDIQILVKFGQNGFMEWGAQFENVPGADGPIITPVQEEATSGTNVRVIAGVFEDPFFFDLDGFNMTFTELQDPAAASDLMFDATRDFFENTNVHAIVVEMDAPAALDGATYLQMWATSGRLTP